MSSTLSWLRFLVLQVVAWTKESAPSNHLKLLHIFWQGTCIILSYIQPHSHVATPEQRNNRTWNESLPAVQSRPLQLSDSRLLILDWINYCQTLWSCINPAGSWGRWRTAQETHQPEAFFFLATAHLLTFPSTVSTWMWWLEFCLGAKSGAMSLSLRFFPSGTQWTPTTWGQGWNRLKII